MRTQSKQHLGSSKLSLRSKEQIEGQAKAKRISARLWKDVLKGRLRKLSTSTSGAKKHFPSTSLAGHDLEEDPQKHRPKGSAADQPSNSVDALIHLMNKVARIDHLTVRDERHRKTVASRHHIAHSSHALLHALAEVVCVESQDSSFLVQSASTQIRSQWQSGQTVALCGATMMTKELPR